MSSVEVVESVVVESVEVVESVVVESVEVESVVSSVVVDESSLAPGLASSFPGALSVVGQISWVVGRRISSRAVFRADGSTRGCRPRFDAKHVYMSTLRRRRPEPVLGEEVRRSCCG